MALIIEDGTEVAGANSYVDVAGLDAYASARNITTLPATEAEKEALLIKAMDYISGKEDKFQGSRVTETQALSFPRSNVVIYGFLNDSSNIPELLKNAQMQLAVDASTIDIQPVGKGREVIKEKVDVIEVEYSEQNDTNVQPVLTKAEAFLDPLYETSSGGLTTIRV